tara:strand:- start:247 stop:609 length:363 start_codon:yes stop_codon:yes gene_type:complete
MSNRELIEKLRLNPRGVMFELEHECADALEKAEAELAAIKAERDEIAKLNHGQFLQLEYLRRVEVAAHELYTQAEEYDFPDGLGQGAAQELWDALATAFEPETEAIAEEIRNRKGEHDDH